MATINGTAILTAIREVLDEGAGTVRNISTARFQADLYAGKDVDGQALSALVKPICEAEITGIRRHPMSPMDLHSMSLLEIDVRVSVVRSGTLKEKLDADARDALKGLAVDDADVVKQALLFNGNLTTTIGGTATGLVSGRLASYEGSTVTVLFSGDTSARIEGLHNFRAVVNVAQATS